MGEARPLGSPDNKTLTQARRSLILKEVDKRFLVPIMPLPFKQGIDSSKFRGT
jgi:hypothetical protein